MQGLQTFLSEGTQAITQQFVGQTHSVMWLFRDVLHSTKSTNFSSIIYILFFHY